MWDEQKENGGNMSTLRPFWLLAVTVRNARSRVRASRVHQPSLWF